MTQITTKLIKQLYEKVDAKLLDCQQALEKTNGDVEAALELLIKEGLAPESNRYGDEGTLKTIESSENSEKKVFFQVDITPKRSYDDRNMTKFIEVIGEELIKQNPSSIESFLQLTYSGDPTLTYQQLFKLTEEVLHNTIELRWFQFEKLNKDIMVICPEIHPTTSRICIYLKGQPDREGLRYTLAYHLIAYQPKYIHIAQVPPEEIKEYILSYNDHLKTLNEKEKAYFIEMKTHEFYQRNCLLELPLLSDESVKVKDEIAYISKTTSIDYSVLNFYFLDVV